MNDELLIDQEYSKAVSGIKEEWFNNADPRWYEYITGLPDKSRITYLVVVLHRQVFNGGFDQYFVNGYGQFSNETVKALREINAFTRADLLKQAFLTVNTNNYSDEVFRERLLKNNIDTLFKNNKTDGELDELDTKYYNMEGEDLIQLLANYLA